MEKEKKPPCNVIIIHETALQSFLVDATTIGGLILATAFARWVGSHFLEVFAGALFLFTVFTRMNRLNRLTVDQARQRLNELEAKFKDEA
jgi:ABC-type phosphate transport system permease subunit